MGGAAIADKAAYQDTRLDTQYGDKPIIGHRTWGVRPSQRGPLLTSMYIFFLNKEGDAVYHIWPPGRPMRALCEHRHKAYESGLCVACGIYALKAPADDYLVGPIRPYNLIVYGQVALWGEVLEHERGYRATLAYPHRLSNIVATHERQDGLLVIKNYHPEGITCQLARTYTSRSLESVLFSLYLYSQAYCVCVGCGFRREPPGWRGKQARFPIDLRRIYWELFRRYFVEGR